MHRQICTLAGAAALAAVAAPGAWAQATYSVDPLLIRLNADSNNAVLTITNPTATEIRFEIKGYAWDQAPPDGAMQLTATGDLVIFPPLVTLAPHSTQRVRVGTTLPQGAIEKAYRIMIEELPSAVRQTSANQVNVRTRVGVPVFLEASKPALSGRIDSVSVTAHAVAITIANTGNMHGMVDNIVVRGMSGPDQVVFEDSLQGWYVLAGKTRAWTYPFKPAQCRPSKFVEVEVYVGDKVLTSRADVPAGACTP